MADPLLTVLERIAVALEHIADRDTKPANDDDGEVTRVRPKVTSTEVAAVERFLKLKGER